MDHIPYLWCWTVFLLWISGCSSTGTTQNRGVAPPLPTPAPYGPGQAPPPSTIAPPPGVGIPVPPGTSAPPGMSPQAAPSTPEQARVQATAGRLYQANPWLTARPQWIVSPNDTPGLTMQGEQYAVISASLVRSCSDGQLAAAMSLQLGDMLAARQQFAQRSTKDRREVNPPPDYFQQRDGMSSTQASLELAEIAKYRTDPRDPRRRDEQQQSPPLDVNTYARQILVQSGYSELELNQVGPLLQRYPMVRPAGR